MLYDIIKYKGILIIASTKFTRKTYGDKKMGSFTLIGHMRQSGIPPYNYYTKKS
jgi:hypothetical protein